MGLPVTFFGSAGDADHERGELGGVQILFDDREKSTRFILDFGQRPDHTSLYYGFPAGPRKFEYLALLQLLKLYPDHSDLINIYRQDYLRAQGIQPGEIPIDAILATHCHYDHLGGLTLLRHDLPVHMSQLSKQVLWLWQQSGGKTLNQFVDLVDSFSTRFNNKGEEAYIQSAQAFLPRDIRIYREEVPFHIKNLEIIAYQTDHSVPGACGLMVDTSVGKIGISGDIRKRGRHPENTEHFVQSLLDNDISYLFWEGSLLHFDHYGTEYDVQQKLAELLEGRNFAAIAYPPRDMERIRSVYESARANDRMLVVLPNQAILMKLLDGARDYPKMDWMYIGVLMPKKNKGRIEEEDTPKNLLERDYSAWERTFLKWRLWSEDNAHASGCQRVTFEDIRKNQDQFLVYMPANLAATMLAEIQPASGGIYIRSHPGPWNAEMQIGEGRLIHILKAFGMYDGTHADYLTPKKRGGSPNMMNLHQVHVTGHMNMEETFETLRRFQCPIIVYHSYRPNDFVENLTHNRIIVPELRQRLILT